MTAVLTRGLHFGSEKMWDIDKIISYMKNKEHKTVSLSYNGYFNAFATRQIVLVYEFDRLFNEIKLCPVFYLPRVEEEIRYKRYGISPLNLFWEREIYTYDEIPLKEVELVVVNTEVPQSDGSRKTILILKQTYRKKIVYGNRYKAFFGKFLPVHQYYEEFFHKHYSDFHMAPEVKETYSKALRFINFLNQNMARIFGLESEYEKLKKLYRVS